VTASTFRRGYQGKGSTGYSPTLKLVTSTGLKYHFQKPDGTICCGRRLKLDGRALSVLTYMELFADWMICTQCIDRVGAYGPTRHNGRPHLSECPAYKGMNCICDDVPYPDADSG
jgi:hypothetical protein